MTRPVISWCPMNHSATAGQETKVADAFATELRKWWSFDDGQVHTHSWHSREDFIKQKLPGLLAAVQAEERDACANIALAIDSCRGNEKEIAAAIRQRGAAS